MPSPLPACRSARAKSSWARRRLPQHRRVRRADPPARRRRDHRQGRRRRRSLIPRRKAWHHRRTGARKGARFVLLLRFVASGHVRRRGGAGQCSTPIRRTRPHRYTQGVTPVPRASIPAGSMTWRVNAGRLPAPVRNPNASFHDQAVRLQVVRRSDHPAPADQHDRRGGPQWLRQVEHHRCRALGHGREFGQPPAWRLADRRDLLRVQCPQAGLAGYRRADLRQLRPHDLREYASFNESRSSARSAATAPATITSTAPSAAVATSPTCSSAPAWARAATRSSSRA